MQHNRNFSMNLKKMELEQRTWIEMKYYKEEDEQIVIKNHYLR